MRLSTIVFCTALAAAIPGLLVGFSLAHLGTAWGVSGGVFIFGLTMGYLLDSMSFEERPDEESQQGGE